MIINGLEYPEDRYYFTISPLHLWIKEENDDSDENIHQLGFTSFLIRYIGGIRTISTRKVGQSLPQGKTLLSIDSGEYVIPMALPIPVTIREGNQRLKKKPRRLNENVYGEWLYRMKIKPEDLSGLIEQETLVKPGSLLEEFIVGEEKMESLEKFNCCPKAFSSSGVVRRKRKKT